MGKNKGSHIDPGTGRNKREVGGIIKRHARRDEIRADGSDAYRGGPS